MTKSTYPHYILTVFFVILSGVIHAQSLSLDWVKSNMTTPNGSIWPSQIVFDREGNILVTGIFQGSVDFGFGVDTTILTSNGSSFSNSNSDGFVLKLTSLGIPLWAKSIGGANNDGGSSILTDTSNSIYVTGIFRDSVDFNPGGNPEIHIGHPYGNAYILKLTEDGDFEWVKTSSPGILSINKVKISEDNHFYLTGSYQDSVDVDFGINIQPMYSNYATAFLGKYDLDFNLIWLDTVTNSFYEYASDLFIDSNENVVYSTVKQYGTIIRLLDSNGLGVWAKQLTGEVKASGIDRDQSGNILLCGTFEGNVDFDPGQGVHIFPYYYGENGFVLKLDGNGGFVWAANVSSGGTNRCAGLITDSLNNVYISGTYQGDVDFDPKMTSNWIPPVTLNYLPDIFIWKLDSLGNLMTVKTFGGSDSDFPVNPLIDSTGSIYNFGYYSGFSNDFSPGSTVISFTNLGGLNACYLIKFNECETIIGHIDSLNVCDSLQWVNGVTYYSNSTNSGTYNFISSTNNGCDSIVGLYLNVRYSTINADSVFSCNPYTWINGITYNYSTQTPVYVIQNSEGCDSSNFLHLEVEYIPLGLMHSVTDNTITTNASGLSYRWLNCNNGMSVIPNQTSQSFTPTANGSYAAEITKNGCIDTTDCMLITTVGLAENAAPGVLLYPNPTKGSFTLQFEQNQHYAEINLFSITGQLTESRKIRDKDSVSFEVNFPNGIYFIEILNQSNEKTVLKLIKD
ncbi:MAG: hypothetical protein K0S23_2885 [Fluviicola sp.]|jgi:hypothetical protein|uniref:T9SS type A sorting domain-containing protein n=1 Tax=Fluviicola sp. TaxID=1917219 RepID=UPI00260FD51E|nr:T9SS type A sorting domain-containing protein [Fluviicola sp.]MDF3028578.1 hypothetical protein [Fluviicola sp.]